MTMIPQTMPTPILRFDHHRTTKNGHLVLAFIDIATGDEVNCFFNVDVRGQRGLSKGRLFRPGMNGRFYPPERGKFRKWWMQVVGKEPLRWGAAYRRLHAQMTKYIFTAESIEIAYRAEGGTYKKAHTVKITKQDVHNLGTSKEQIRHITAEQRSVACPVLAGPPDESNCTTLKVHEYTDRQSHGDTSWQLLCPHCLGEGCAWCDRTARK